MEYIHIDKQYYCGVDLHANLIYICVLRKSGKVVLHQEITTEFPQFLKVIKPYLSSIAVPPCKHNFGLGTIFPLTAGLYLYVGLPPVGGQGIFFFPLSFSKDRIIDKNCITVTSGKIISINLLRFLKILLNHIPPVPVDRTILDFNYFEQNCA